MASKSPRVRGLITLGSIFWTACYDPALAPGNFQCARPGECVDAGAETRDIELSVLLQGIAAGRVESALFGENGCAKGAFEVATCRASVLRNARVTLTASAAIGAELARWDGCPAWSEGDTSCAPATGDDVEVSVAFGYRLAVEARAPAAGTSGTVTLRSEGSDPYLETCGTDRGCEGRVFIGGETVTLEVMPVNARVIEWSGCDAALGENICAVAMTEARRVAVLLGPVDCGNGEVGRATEECDDGNNAGGDGCSPVCLVEPGYRCDGARSDCRGFVVSKTAITTTENGPVQTFTVSLTNPPAGRVILPVRSDREIEAVAITSLLTFTSTVLSQTVQIASTDDLIDEPDRAYLIVLGPADDAGDGFYSGLRPADVAGTNVDDDPEPELAISDGEVLESEGVEILRLAVTLSRASAFEVAVDWATADGTATSGAGADYEAVSGTLIFAPGATSAELEVRVLGDVLDEGNESFLVTLRSPRSAALGARSTGEATIIDDDGAPSLFIAGAQGMEPGTVSFLVQLTSVSAETVTVDWETDDGSAQAPGDYLGGTGTLTFDPGTTSRTIDIAVQEDSLNEAEETFLVRLANAAGATLINTSATGTIRDDDPLPALSITDVERTEAISMTFTVTLSALSGREVTAEYDTSNGIINPATPIVDFDPVIGGIVRFDPGMITQTITIPVQGDLLDELDETFTVTLRGENNATIAVASAVGTILDDDPTPALSIADAAVTEGDGVSRTSMDFLVTLSAASALPVRVDYVSDDNSATAGADYGRVAGTLMFAPGATSRTITVLAHGDELDEENETFFVELLNANHATILEDTATGTIDDNDPLPSLSIADPLFVADEGTGTLILTVTLSPASGRPVEVYCETLANTATPPTDYTYHEETLTFAPGTTEVPFGVAIQFSSEQEVRESFFVRLSAETNSTVSRRQATVFIDDGAAAAPPDRVEDEN